MFGKNIKENELHYINISNISIKSQNVVKLLGINIDIKLSFDEHISELCIKT